MGEFINRVPSYPTAEHRRIATGLAGILAADPRVWAVAVTGSLAWGGATSSSDIDISAFVEPEVLEAARAEDWASRFSALGAEEDPVLGLCFGPLRADVDLTDGRFVPGGLPRADDYELAIGNHVAYVALLHERDGRYRRWAAQYLPYLDETWRTERMQLVWGDLAHNLRQTREMADRGLLFHGLERLTYAVRYVVHYLFLQERKHALDWFKHLEWQAAHILGRPELPRDLARILALPELSAALLRRHADELETLMPRYLQPPR